MRNPGFGEFVGGDYSHPVVAEADRLRHECGVVGVRMKPGSPVAAVALTVLGGLQHRGEQAAGVAVNGTSGLTGYKNNGLIGDVAAGMAQTEHGQYILESRGNPSVAIAQTRYCTTANRDVEAAQPFWLPNFALGHNGHIEGLDEIAAAFGTDVTSGVSDSHKLTLLFSHCLDYMGGDMEAVLHTVLPYIDSAYCLTIIDGDRLIAVRDPRGVHPLALGTIDSGVGGGYAVASEPVAFERAGIQHLRDVEPGEIVVVNDNGIASSRIDSQADWRPCMYEYIYMARFDGPIDGVRLALARQALGRSLAEDNPVEADIVVGVPDSGMLAALGYAQASGIELAYGLRRDPHVRGRSFIQDPATNRRILEHKITAVEAVIAGKDVAVIDDSKIKGNVSRNTVSLLRKVGATAVHFFVTAPPYRYACRWGMDTGDESKLIARRHMQDNGEVDAAAVAREIGASSVGYLRPERILQAMREAQVGGSRRIDRLCTFCFDGIYPPPARAHVPSQRGLPGTPVAR